MKRKQKRKKKKKKERKKRTKNKIKKKGGKSYKEKEETRSKEENDKGGNRRNEEKKTRKPAQSTGISHLNGDKLSIVLAGEGDLAAGDFRLKSLDSRQHGMDLGLLLQVDLFLQKLSQFLVALRQEFVHTPRPNRIPGGNVGEERPLALSPS